MLAWGWTHQPRKAVALKASLPVAGPPISNVRAHVTRNSASVGSTYNTRRSRGDDIYAP